MPRPEETAENLLRTSTGFLLAELGAESRRRFNQALGRRGLTQSQFSVLMAVSNLGPASQQQIGTFIGIDPRNLVGVLDALEQRVLLIREADPADRRRHLVRLTSSGRTALNQLASLLQREEEQMLSELSSAQHADLHRLLVRLLPTLADREPKGPAQTGHQDLEPRS